MPETCLYPTDTTLITGLFAYPIKGCAGTSLTVTTLDATGLRFDRRWMVVAADTGKFLTQRDLPQMACLHPVATTEGLAVSLPGQEPLRLPLVPDAALHRRDATVWSYTGETRDEGDTAAEWLSDALGVACRLVRTPEDFSRRVSPKYAQEEDRVSFADGYPILIASEASLADLNTHLVSSLPMNRFRANIVVAGTMAWDEEAWGALETKAGLRFRVAKPCARCAVTTVDQVTGQKTGAEPLATLARLRRTEDGKVNFGMNLIHNAFGPGVTLRVGESLTISR